MTARKSHYGPFSHPHFFSIKQIKQYVRQHPANAQAHLLVEYSNPEGPRWTLVQWLKRHRLHNPTVRVIPNR